MSKTIRQIAEEIGVSKQAVHKKRKSKELSTSLQQFTSTVDGVIYISDDGEKLLKTAFEKNDRQPVDVNEPSTVDGRIDTLISMLQHELEIKNQQIERLTVALEHTTASLHAAQALHAGTMKHQLTDGGDQAAPSAPTKKFFTKIFSKKSW